jgi:hypothetical protein
MENNSKIGAALNLIEHCVAVVPVDTTWSRVKRED